MAGCWCEKCMARVGFYSQPCHHLVKGWLPQASPLIGWLGRHKGWRSQMAHSPFPSDVGIRHVQGSTRGIALLMACTGGKLTIHIPDGRTGGDDKASSMLSSHISALIRQHVPFDACKWKEVPEGRSAINKENRAKLKIVHTSKARSFHRARALLEKMEALQLQYESEGKSYTEVEIFAEVLGMKAGYVQGLGHSVRSVGSSSSVSSVDLSRRLEEARLQIEEMRARQLEYEALLVKRSDMEQTM
ncbi:hypothetical protein CJ030_MR5G001877 [Morella rubra]|uniref:Uncharacterized protein n=1 Tax=Morella rubra TaxID=262757 RepID=A0A6A1VK26_9ROSI|nr:hypothetical protein CJ030_MR5G001877 [Morella rubra]